MILYLKIIHRPHCELFHVGTICFLRNYICQPHHCPGESEHLLVDERLATERDVDINGVLLG